jgi:LPXTG-site transpeptidase (sortase) family protein
MIVGSLPEHERATMPDRHGDYGSRPLRWLERLFLIAGAGALIWCAVIVSDGLLAQRNAERALEIAMAVDELTDSMPEPAKEPSQHVPIEEPWRHPPAAVGAAMAGLSIPRVQLSAIVLHGSDARTLRRGPGHLEQSALPGDAGNIVIAGHRDSFFRPLRHIRLADDIFLETRDGHFHYRVTSLSVVGPREVSVIAPTSEETLTLITCYPFWVLGRAPDRFIVRAARVDRRSSSGLVAWSLPAHDWLDAPVLHTTNASHPRSTPVFAPTDDDSLVRLAVQRYLAVVGVQADVCAVSVTGDRATAECESVGQSLPGRGRARRLFELDRSNQAWGIRSIVLDDGGS